MLEYQGFGLIGNLVQIGSTLVQLGSTWCNLVQIGLIWFKLVQLWFNFGSTLVQLGWQPVATDGVGERVEA